MALRTDAALTRCGIVVSRRVGGAVVRNRVRRRVREIVRALLPSLAPGWDVALTARGRAAQAPFAELRGAVTELFTRARVLAPPPAALPSDMP